MEGMSYCIRNNRFGVERYRSTGCLVAMNHSHRHRVISLLQPWASLVVMGHKKIETRSWGTRHRGELLIHASMGKAGALLAPEPPFSNYVSDFRHLPFGAIIGQVTLVDVVRVEHLPLSGAAINHLSLEERAFGDYSHGRYAWLFEEAIQFSRPFPIRGTLGLWEYSGELPK